MTGQLHQYLVLKQKMGPTSKILTYGFWVYNKSGEMLKRRKRRLKGELENPMDPIDPIEIPYLSNIKERRGWI